MDILKQLGKRIIFFEGGMGSILQQNGLAPGELPEVWNVEKPEFILNVHREYLKAGCDIVKTNTFGANSIKMEDSGYTAKELIEKAVAKAISNKHVTIDFAEKMDGATTLKTSEFGHYVAEILK